MVFDLNVYNGSRWHWVQPGSIGIHWVRVFPLAVSSSVKADAAWSNPWQASGRGTLLPLGLQGDPFESCFVLPLHTTSLKAATSWYPYPPQAIFGTILDTQLQCSNGLTVPHCTKTTIEYSKKHCSNIRYQNMRSSIMNHHEAATNDHH